MKRLVAGILLLGTAIPASTEPLDAVVAKVMPSIVSISAESAWGGVVSGTGFIIEATGTVAANLRAVEGAQRVVIKLQNGEVYDQITVATFDKQHDLAILKLPDIGLSTVDFADGEVAVGQAVFTARNTQGLEATVSAGVISAIRVLDDGTRLIDTDAAASPDFSGGPLFNAEGEVVGVVTYETADAKRLIVAMASSYVRALQGFERTMSLDEFAQELRGTDSPLFDGMDETTLSGTWRSLTSNTHKALRQDGKRLTGFYSYDADSVKYDLTLQHDGHYRGRVKAALTINEHRDEWTRWESRTCEFETGIVLRAVTPDRIEGRIHGYEVPTSDDPNAREIACLGSEPLKWIDFVWVRVE